MSPFCVVMIQAINGVCYRHAHLHACLHQKNLKSEYHQMHRVALDPFCAVNTKKVQQCAFSHLIVLYTVTSLYISSKWLACPIENRCTCLRLPNVLLYAEGTNRAAVLEVGVGDGFYYILQRLNRLLKMTHQV
ncbi:hypothetical protein ACJX0J_010619 [Zea mays]